MGVGGSCRPNQLIVTFIIRVHCRSHGSGSVRDLKFSVDQLAQDSVEVVLYSVVSGSRGCPYSCGWPVEWVGPLWLGDCLWGGGAVDLLVSPTVFYTGYKYSFDGKRDD